jgi:TRAP-type C4-dicarboxylate transport system permease small subunit
MQNLYRSTLQGMLISMVGALLVLMTTQIVMRYGFNSSLLWAEEMCRYMLIWLSFLGIVMSYERGEVAALTFISNALPRRGALVLAIFTTFLSLGMCLLLVWYGWRFANITGGSQVPAMRFILGDIFGDNAPEAPKVFWIYIALPVGVGLLALRLSADIALCVRAWGTGETLEQALMRHERAAAL